MYQYPVEADFVPTSRSMGNA